MSRLRAAGFPVAAEDEPRVVGEVLLLVSDFVPDAEPAGELTDDLVDQLLALSELQAGLAADDTEDPWPDWLHRSLTYGMNGWSRPAVVLADPRTAGLGERAVRWAEAAMAVPAGADLMHGDLHPGNILVRDGRVVALVDATAARPGDRWFDLLTLLWVTGSAGAEPRVHDRLRAAVEANVALATLRVLTAHVTVRALDWALTYRPDLLDELVTRSTMELDRYGI